MERDITGKPTVDFIALYDTLNSFKVSNQALEISESEN